MTLFSIFCFVTHYFIVITIILLLEIVRILCKITGLAFVNKYSYLKLSPERYLNVETAFMILFFSILQLIINFNKFLLYD